MTGEEVELCTGDRLELPSGRLSIHFREGASRCGEPRKDAGRLIGVRNERTAQESVVMLPELDALVP